MSTPFFSVIIPVYNTARDYLEPCLNSLINQTFADIEIILVDDGSKEPCAQLLDEYAQTDDRIRVIHQQNQGVSAARNNGIQAARADWLLFVDADDWVELNTCETLKEHLEETDCDILQFNAVREYADRQVNMNHGLEAGRLYDTSDVDTREFLYRKVMNVPGNACVFYYSCDKVIKRAFLMEHDLRYPVGVPKSEDKVFFLGCYEKLRKLCYVDYTLYHYRMNSASAVHRYNDKADANCSQLASLLMEIAQRMDRELGEKKNQPGYDRISRDCNRFIFGILSDVLFLKYFHPDNPAGRMVRAAEAEAFLNSEPFRTVIASCAYSELSNEAKLKKFLLGNGLASVFCFIKNTYARASGKVAK